ncbi:MAG: phosphoglycolate phosphatase [Candidatus Methanogaster sp.]|uniref:Phosphoglycolate phosphatase n=1 Tax=Candidatus Methanogaster sp. TaxID=3386292 RepID=A0AC61L0A7_9EURY|nr:MAG: phosphoglycolate phosphatase [ANME-2 cluster archaeon]
MIVKAIAIDIDGTLTHKNRSIDCRAVACLRSLDIPIVLATGNVLCFARAAAKLIGTDGQIIAENGGVISLEYDGTEYYDGDIDACEHAFDALTEHLGTHIQKLDSEYRKTEIALRRNFDALDARQIVGEDIDVVDSGYAIHLKSKDVDKGTGLFRIADLMGIDASDFAAIGDSANDLQLLAAAGFGVAVGNADPALKGAADLVTAAEYGAGVVEAIEYLARWM